MIEPDDLKALDARYERLVRSGVAAAVRMQAAALRSTASLMASEARTLDTIADGIEDGSVEMPQRAVPLKLVPVDDEPEAEPDDDEPEAEPMLQPIDAREFGRSGLLMPLGGGDFDPAMAEWLDLFDDRLRRSSYFAVEANVAATAGQPATETTARVVADRIREREQADEARGRPRGGGTMRARTEG